jgi:transposase
MPRKLHVVHLTQDDRDALRAITRTGTHPARTITRARILLLADTVPWERANTDVEIAETVGVHWATVKTVRAAWTAQGLACIHRKVRATPPTPPKLADEQVVKLLALACATDDLPPGYAHWSVRLLTDRAIALGIITDVSAETVRRALKKTGYVPGRPNAG